METPRHRRPHVTEGDTPGKPCRKSLCFQGEDVPQVEETQETQVEEVERTKPIKVDVIIGVAGLQFFRSYSDIFKYVRFLILCMLPNVI